MFFLPRTQRNYAREVGDGLGNSIVVAAVMWVARNFPEAPVKVEERQRDRSLEQLFDHPLLDLLDNPNPYYSGILMWMATLTDWNVHGNAYWLKVRSAAGQVVQLYYVPQNLIKPVADVREYIAGYEYDPGGSKKILLAREDVVHFRYGIDPRDPTKGMSPLASLLREVFTDDEAGNFSASVLSNLGVPGVVVSPAAGAMNGSGPSLDIDADSVKQDFQQRFSGDRRGEPIIMTAPTDIKVLAWSPQQMDLRDLRRLPEERVSAVLGIPAVVLGLGAGLDRSTYANYREAREAAYESNLIPAQRLLGKEIETQLLPDFEASPERLKRLTVGFDVSGVRALAEDQDKLYNRARTGLLGGFMRVDEARASVSLPVNDSHKVFLRFKTRIEVPEGSSITEVIRENDDIYLPKGGASGGDPFAEESDPDAGSEVDTDTDVGDGEEPKGRRGWTKAQGTGLADKLRQILEERTGTLEADLLKFFENQGLRVAGRVLDGADLTPEALLPAEEDTRLRTLWLSHAEDLVDEVDAYLTSYLASAKRWRPRWKASDPYGSLGDLLDELGNRIVGINETTRAAVGRTVEWAQDTGIGRYALANGGGQADPGFRGLRTLVAETYTNRALTIARTELANAENLTAVYRYSKAGLSEVDIMDGDGCGWSTHDDGDKANGTRRSLDDLRQTPISHPNCVRVPLPVVT